MKRLTFKEYTAEESGKLLSGERLLAPEQVMERLTITRRQLQELHRGENPKGLFLPAGQEDHPLPTGRRAARGVAGHAGRRR